MYLGCRTVDAMPIGPADSPREEETYWDNPIQIIRIKININIIELLTNKLTDSITSRNTSFFLYLIPSLLHDTALVMAGGGLGATSNF